MGQRPSAAALRESVDESGSTSRSAPGGRRALPWLLRRPELPWTAVAVLAVALPAISGDGLTSSVVYGAYWAAAVVIPGVLLHRALVGSSTLPEDIGFGSIIGLCWQLVGWFFLTALQAQALLWVWPVALMSVFVLVPGLRRHWKGAGRQRVPLAVSWSAGGAMALALLVLYVTWLRTAALPPNARLVEPDLWYHLAINNELTRTVFPQVPYVAGHALHYHWFANVHMASGQMMTGIAPASIVLHLWLVPMVATLFLATWALSRWLTGLWWPGVLGATLTAAVPVAVRVTSVEVGLGPSPVVYASCSSVLAGVVMVGLARHLLQPLRRTPTGGDWAALTLLVVLAAGTKPTLLPLALAGTAVAAAFLLARRRHLRSVLCVLALLAVGMVLGFVAVTGSTAGSEWRLFGYFRSIEAYRRATGDYSVEGVTGGWAVPGVLDSGWPGGALALALLAGLLLFHLPSLMGVFSLVLPSTRTDVAVWWLSGAIAASLGPVLLVDHMGFSEKFFLMTVFPLGVALSLHMLAATLPESRGRSFRWSVTGVFLAGALAASIAFGASAAYRWSSIGPAVASMMIPVSAFLVMLAGVLTWSRRRPVASERAGWSVALVCALVLGWSVPQLLTTTVGRAMLPQEQLPVAQAGPRLSVPKQQAALWLSSHAAIDDVVVTNAHCFKLTPNGCDARGFWISALSGHRVFLEGWGYTPENALTTVRPSVDYRFQPSPWPRRLRQSNLAVTAPTPRLLDSLATAHDVRWVFADKTVRDPSPLLWRLARLRYENRDVAIFELRQG